MELLQKRRNALIADERWVAVLLSCALNLAGCWFLLRSPALEPHEDPVPPRFIEVIFVDRAVVQMAEPSTLQSGASSTVGRRTKGQGQPTSELSAGRPPKAGTAAAISSPMPMNLVVPHVPMQLAEHNPFERSQGQPLPVGPELNLRFIDRSLGGALQRMSRSGACRQLRMALASQSASAESILATMQRYGCGS